MQLNHKTLLSIQGAVWFGIGALLLYKGITFLMNSMQPGSENTALLLMVAALLVGQLKGRFVMKKVAIRSIQRIQALANPTSLANIYTKGNYAVIGGMMLLGMCMKFLHLPEDIRGFIDVAVGCALIQGSLFYFKFAGATNQTN